MPTPFLTPLACLSAFTVLWLSAGPAHGQSSCNSDAQPAPQALFERFINADCGACWSDANTPKAPPSALALDWILPGSQGDDAALGAAATQDAAMRLAVLNQDHPKAQGSITTPVSGWSAATLRVAHGPAVNGYLGASITLTLPAGTVLHGPLQAWLLMVETLPVGFEHSPVSRNLVRNVLQPSWNMHQSLPKSEQLVFNEIRPLTIPPEARPERLNVVGWIQNAHGQVLMAATSACVPEDK